MTSCGGGPHECDRALLERDQVISCAWQMCKAHCHRCCDAIGQHDPRMLYTSVCSSCLCSKARVISHLISARCAKHATPARYRLGIVDNSYAGESSVGNRGQPAGMHAFVPTRLARAAPDVSTSAPACTSRTMSARDSSCDDSMDGVHGIIAAGILA